MSEFEPNEPLAPQIATSPEVLASGKFDMMLLSNIDSRHIRALLYFTLLAHPERNPEELLVETFLKAKVCEGGRGRRDLIRMEAVRHGGAPDVAVEMPRQNIVERIRDKIMPRPKPEDDL